VSLGDRSFAGPTAVGRYWIAHAEGFAVESARGRTLGTVDSVAVDPRTAETMLVLARSPLPGRRPQVVPARRVASVLPWSRRLVLAQTAKAPSPSATPKRKRTGERLQRVAPLLRAAGRSGPPALAALGAGARGARRVAVAAEQTLRLLPGAAATVGGAAARALKAYAIWLSLTLPPLACAARAGLERGVRFAARHVGRAVSAVRNDARSLRLSPRR
jgi:hypothetical protein